MKPPRSLWMAFCAAIAGSVMLAIWFVQSWPPRNWPFQEKADLIRKGRPVAKHFGVDVTGWNAYAVPTVNKTLAFFVKEYPRESEKLGISPLSLQVTYVLKNKKDTAEVGFDSAGTLIYWRAPDRWTGGQKFESDAAASADAFAFFTQRNAASYRNPIRTMGDELHEEDYEWRLNPQPNSQFREWIKAESNNSVIKTVERHRYFSNEDEDSDAGDGRQYWKALAGIFNLLVAVASVAIIAIFVLWWARKVIPYAFPIRLAVACFVLVLIKMFGGTDWDKLWSVQVNRSSPIGSGLFYSCAIICLATVGRGFSVRGRVKWIGLEQLSGLAPVSKRTGESLAAGLLFSPLLAAIAFFIAGSGIVANSWVLPKHAELLYGRAAALDSLQVSSFLYLLLFFGFGIPALERIIGNRWLRSLLVLPMGTLYFAEEAQAISGPIAAALLAGTMILAVFWFVWDRFDLLAVLTMQACSGFVITALMFTAKGHLPLGCVVAMTATAALAALCYWRGHDVYVGDPRATIPGLTGFRAEREKLQAEFSVAKRAQEDMLPRAAPQIDGYTLAASCTPSLDVGGDLYDFWWLPDGRVGIGVADVSGKGVPAALYMTLTKGLMAAVTKSTSDLPRVMQEVNRHLHGVTRKKVFVTMVLGFLDARQRKLECARAGHNPAVWRQAAQDMTTLVSPGGLGLGITAGKVFGAQLKVEEMQLNDGDAVVFYSDGITEAMNRALEQFGEERLMDAVRRTDHMDAATARESILGEVKKFLDGVHPQDDMTLVVLRVGANS